MKCGKKLSLEDCEIQNLKLAIKTIEEIEGRKLVTEPLIIRIVSVIEAFLRNKRLVCYGGTAINNILPLEAQFYDRNTDIPDYDFFSPTAMEDARLLANIYHALGFNRVEAKAGVHFGTYKVYVNFIPIADITQVEPRLFSAIWKHSLKVDEIHYADPNYLRMAMYLELSRPRGDISRWEKVYKRLVLLNRYYPLVVDGRAVSAKVGAEDRENHSVNSVDSVDRQKTEQACANIAVQREFDLPTDAIPETDREKERTPAEIREQLYTLLKRIIVDYELVFFGAYATALYRHKEDASTHSVTKTPDFDVLSLSPETTAQLIRDRLTDAGYREVRLKKQNEIGEIIAPHVIVSVGGHPVITIYEPLACHSYNEVSVGKQTLRIASIDTIMSFYLAFLYADRKYYDTKRILCMAAMLFAIQDERRGDESGVLHRFSTECYGEQKRLADILAEKQAKFLQLRGDPASTEYQRWFLKYNPADALPPADIEVVANADIVSTIRRIIAQDKATRQSVSLSTSARSKTLKKHRKHPPSHSPRSRRTHSVMRPRSKTQKQNNRTSSKQGTLKRDGSARL